MTALFKLVFDNLSSCCLICDEKKRVVFANESLLYRGQGPNIELPCHELLFLLADQCPWCAQQEVMAGRSMAKKIFNPRDQMWYSLLLAPVSLENNTTGCLHIVTPIEEGDATGDKLQRYAYFLEKMIENAPIMIVGNKDGKICLFNEECQKVTGYKREEVLGKNLFDLFVTEDEKPRVKAHCELVCQGDFEPGFEFRWKTKDGRLRDIIWNCMLLEDPDGAPIVLGMGVDITEKKRLEEQFLQAQKMETVGRMAGGLAHDINNFLTAVRSSAELALIDLKDVENVRRNLERILIAVKRTGSLTKQLLTFSRKEIIRPEYLDLNDVIRELADMLHKLLGEDIQLETILSHHVGSIYADRNQFEQILVNLAVNARDAMPSGGVLQIETGRICMNDEYFPEKIGLVPGDYAVITVSDTGEGMDPRIVPYVFDPFFTTKPKGKGTGLGLSTVYSIIKQNGGHINLYSEPGQGTTFKIYWPVALSGEHTKVAASHSPKKGEFVQSKGKTILVTEDDPIVLDSVCGLLDSLGYNVLKARDVQEAVEVSRRHPGEIDLLFTDVVLPGSDGRTLYEKIKQERPFMKVLFTSGYTENIISKRGILDNGVHFLQKPYELAHLAGILRQVLDGVD